ncbi:regulator of ribosome biosynthesis [Angomonas deanei]|uniref:Ribosome biogenesis regulatory protein n=1 Tax=Angomonas deanei TaxID=59799 RepID=S9VQS0_9TRYP|nr:regulator of ribosome biosynthesis [Angomonas deanei]EPY34881.1 regulator of ribosome biosynthesis [Angomonas deanei]EPY38430.1 regulator of ribosome biosynthesis [Angomonas deanei]EPY43253.1 regulator of ribosome biosynthesis [Angomonas deanei]CAD2218244.1 Ribosome biogenesis regulatory protein (RRS1), putative [Angomonas deanei]|eukprot:EPY24869.1 regulator of ribosome biosynthesis [Angomonas deanei]
MSEYHVDAGLLSVTNASIVSGPMRREEDLMESCESALKVLLGEFVQLPTVVKKGKFDGAITLVQLPQPVMQLPREKAPPKPKPLTAWQKFALKKGIDIHRKKENKVFDEERQVWKDKWGKRAREDRDKYDWLREVKPSYVPQEEGGDPFLDERREKKERLDKQKKKEEHNKRRAELISQSQDEVKHLQSVSRNLTTASNGKFEKNTKFKKNTKKMHK